jgi:hypothetical protein
LFFIGFCRLQEGIAYYFVELVSQDWTDENVREGGDG